MNDVSVKNLECRFQIHYYFDDDSHSMNAIVRHNAEKDVFDTIKRLCELLDVEYRIETEAYEEGGLKEKLVIILLGTLTFFAPAINDILTYHFTTDFEAKELDKKIQEQEWVKLLLENKDKIKELENSDLDKKDVLLELEQEIKKIAEDGQVTRSVSNYYKKIDKYEKVEKVSFQNVDSNVEETSIERKRFTNFILLEDTTRTIDENAYIEIISPVLNEGRFKWRGLYKGEEINFSMGDTKFKKNVANKKYKFSNGSFIICVLVITSKYNDLGENTKTTYSVQNVLEVTDMIGAQRTTLKGKKKKREEFESKQKGLFSFDDA